MPLFAVLTPSLTHHLTRPSPMALVISWPFQCWPVMVLSVPDLVTTGFCFVFEENHLVVSGARFILSLELFAKIINIYIYTHVHTDQIQLSRIVKGNWSKRYWKLLSLDTIIGSHWHHGARWEMQTWTRTELGWTTAQVVGYGSVRVKKNDFFYPLDNWFFDMKYHHWTGLWWFGPFFSPQGHLGGLGGLCGVWGACENQIYQFPHETIFGPEMSFFGPN